ncbi:MAG TPA: alpha/beta fold hydrolase [Prolixibacteraceae bacterium]|nr:alpha/beta fold hydrolase [Prolixibacteraceae bacterium]
MKKLFLKTLKVILILYVLICGLLFFFQEKMIFFPQKLAKDYPFTFEQNFEEINIKTPDQVVLNGLLFKADSSKGLIFYLHGNAGSLKRWGSIYSNYEELKYDLFMLDYRGYGKSEGSIKSQEQLFMDVQAAYNEMLKRTPEEKVVIIGFSIGSGIAAKLASENHPKLLILEAPYYNLTDMMHHRYPFVPGFLLKYKLETNRYLNDCKMPVVIFHGTSDQVIYYGSSLKLKEHFKPQDTLITLEGQEHNGISDNADYITALSEILRKGEPVCSPH